MGIQNVTRNIIATSIERKQNFNRGNVSGVWKDRQHFRSHSDTGRMPNRIADKLIELSENAELFVLYSFSTPMAWYSLSDSNSNGTGKWYYVAHHYSQSTTQHQHAYRMGLKGKNVVILSLDENGNLVEVEKEFY